jgi:hypothetical protein
MLLCEGYATSWVRAHNICELVKEFKGNENVDVPDCIESGKNAIDIDTCRRYMRHECGICTDEYPMNKVCSTFKITNCTKSNI